MQGEGLCPTDASTQPIERLFALRDELDEKRWRCGFDYLRVRQPVRALPLDLGDSPLDQNEALKIGFKDAIQVQQRLPEWIVSVHAKENSRIDRD